MFKAALALVAAVSLSFFPPTARAFDNSAFTNVVGYWGQNSNGWLYPDDPNAAQKRLSFYCGDDSPIDVFPVAFLNTFYAQGGLPALDLSNICSTYNADVFPNTSLPDCRFLTQDIQDCQGRGKIVTLSLGGAFAKTDFADENAAADFAELIWNLFLGGQHEFRPFGDAILDGVDLDLEGGGLTGDVTFVNKIRELTDADNSRQYYVTAAPQCPYPDVNLQGTLNQARFDAVYVQFYNNYCSLPTFGEDAFNFGVWDVWAKTISPNKDIKVYLGAPGSRGSAGTGYVPADELSDIATSLRNSFPSFGGVMFWDASTAYANNRIDLALKKALRDTGATGFSFPKCNASDGTWARGRGYANNSRVVHDGYIWEASHGLAAGVEPGIDPPTGDWVPVTACGGDDIPTNDPTSTKTPTATNTKSTRPTSTCAGCSTPTTDPGLVLQGRKHHCIARPSKRKALGEL